MKKLLLILLVAIYLATPALLFAQKGGAQLAYQYFKNKEYEAAANAFYNLYEITKSRSYFSHHITCLLQLEEYSRAEKSVKKEIRKYPQDNSFQIELGYIYKTAGNAKKAKKQYYKTISNIAPNKREYINVANALSGKDEYELAIETYKTGRLVLKDNHLFHIEIARIFLSQRNFEPMVDEYIEALAFSPELLTLVQNQLQSALSSNAHSDLNDILKSKLLHQVKTNNKILVFKELLLWYHTQEKQFELAFELAKSINLISDTSDEKLMQLAQSANSNKNYIIAQKCYKLILDKGSESKYYNIALIENLENKHQALEAKLNPQDKAWKNLYNEYSDYFKNLKDIKQSIHTLIRYAHLSAFKLNKIEEAKLLLETALTSKNLKQRDYSNIKLELADITLLDNKKWDAILLYSQIETENKTNPIGYEAKFRKARVSYFLGEFDWAKSQLDASKGSTSKLTANDALDLSQLISDNTTEDSTYSAMKYFAEADFLIFQNKIDSAKIMFENFFKTFPGHSLCDEVHYKLHEIYCSQQNDTKAIDELNLIIKNHPHEKLAAKALYKQALLFESLNRIKESSDNYTKIIIYYPESIYSVKARKKYTEIRNKGAN